MKKFTATLLSASALILSAVGSVIASPGPPPPTVVPEPGTFALLGLGAVGLVVYKKFKK
jgi:hypothetical protein